MTGRFIDFAVFLGEARPPTLFLRVVILDGEQRAKNRSATGSGLKVVYDIVMRLACERRLSVLAYFALRPGSSADTHLASNGPRNPLAFNTSVLFCDVGIASPAIKLA